MEADTVRRHHRGVSLINSFKNAVLARGGGYTKTRITIQKVEKHSKMRLLTVIFLRVIMESYTGPVSNSNLQEEILWN